MMMRDSQWTDLQQRLAAANGFILEALDANRDGRLTREQIALLKKDQASTQRTLFLVGLTVVVGVASVTVGLVTQIGLAEVVQNGLPLILVFGVAGVMLMWVGRRWEPYRRDIASGQVVSQTGLGRRVHAYLEGDPAWYCTVGTAANLKQFEVTEAGFRAWVDGLIYRVYYLPESDKLLNLEVLGPPPQAAEAR